MNPNLLAYTALILWPVVALYLYSTRPIGPATIWTVLGGYLLLPVGAAIKFELIPAFDKDSIPNLAALAGCILVARRFPRVWHGFGIVEILILMLLLGPLATSLLNSDPVRVGPVVLPGIGYHEAASVAVDQFIYIIPFILARQVLRSSADITSIFLVLVSAGLAYSLLILFEIRMSPQLHTWIYGYFPHSWIQQLRDGGFRPVVFLGHGLRVAFFVMTVAVAAAALWRVRKRIFGLPLAGITAYLGVVLVLCKTLGAMVYGAFLIPLTRWARSKTQVRVAIVLATIALAYPILRTIDFVPTTFLVEAAGAVSADRADSLRTRFDHEAQLLDHAWQRPLFGWGRFGRNRIFDAETGRDISITDGYWVIVLGQFGLVGFLAQFGLLALTVFRAAAVFRLAESETDRVFLAALALIVAINMVDLLPNSTISPWTWLLAGALLGRAEALRSIPRSMSLTRRRGAEKLSRAVKVNARVQSS